jgi:hypothetical protein
MKHLHYISIIEGKLSRLAIMKCGEQGFFPHFVIKKKLAKFSKKLAKLVEFTLNTQKKHLKKI